MGNGYELLCELMDVNEKTQKYTKKLLCSSSSHVTDCAHEAHVIHDSPFCIHNG